MLNFKRLGATKVITILLVICVSVITIPSLDFDVQAKTTASYDYISAPINGYCRVGVGRFVTAKEESTFNGVYGLITSNGKEVVKPTYRDIGNVYNNIAIMQDKNSLWGAVTTTGAVIVKPTYDDLFEFTSGVAQFRSGKKWGIIDKDGNIIKKATYSYIGDSDSFPFSAFDDGVALYNVGGTVKYIGETGYKVVGGKWGVIDSTGEELTSAKYDEIFPYSNGYAVFRSGSKYGLLDDKGVVVLNKGYDRLSAYSNGALVFGVKSGKDYKYGIIDVKGKVLAKAKYDYISNVDYRYYKASGEIVEYNTFKEGAASYLVVDKNGKARVGVISSDGKELTKALYDRIGFRWVDGRAVVLKGEKFGVVDNKGKVIVPVSYTLVGGTNLAGDENAWLPILNKNFIAYAVNGDSYRNTVSYDAKYGIMDNTGKIIKSPSNILIWQSAYDPDIDYVFYSVLDRSGDTKWGVLNKKGNVAIKAGYDSILSFKEGFAACITGKDTDKNKKIVLYNINTGKPVSSRYVDYTGIWENRIVSVDKDGKYHLLDYTGRLII